MTWFSGLDDGIKALLIVSVALIVIIFMITVTVLQYHEDSIQLQEKCMQTFTPRQCVVLTLPPANLEEIAE